MNKIKLFIASMLGAIALVFACVLGTRVNAESVNYGTCIVSTTTYVGDTKTWGFTTNLPSSNTTIAIGSDINGIISAKDGTQAIAIKSSSSNGYDTYQGSEFLVPVPSANSTGTVTRTGNNSSTRYLALGSNAAVALAKTMTFDFDTDDIETNPKLSNDTTVTGYYLRFVVSGGEAKTTGISVQLKDGTTTYGEVAVLYTVTYKDGSTTLSTDDAAAKGSKITYVPKKYGYSFEGWYTDSALTAASKIDTTTYTVTGDVTLYANWTAWTDNKIGVNTLTGEAIEKITTGIDGNLTNDLALVPSIYTAMSGVGMTTTNVTLPSESSATQAPCFNTNGAVKTNGNGIKFTAPADGTLTAIIGAGGGSKRNIKLTNGTDTLDPTTGSVVVGDIESARYTPVEITYTLEKNTTYYLGGDNGVRIYYISFEATNDIADVATLSFDAQYDEADATAATKLRFIGTIEGLAATNYANIYSITFTFDFNGTTGRKCAVTQLYLSITTDDKKYEAADNKMYFVYQLDGIRKYTDNQKLTNCKLTVVFTDGSSKTEPHADIELPTFA